MKISVEKLELKKKVNKNSERNLSSKLQREFLHEKNLVEKKKKNYLPRHREHRHEPEKYSRSLVEK